MTVRPTLNKHFEIAPSSVALLCILIIIRGRLQMQCPVEPPTKVDDKKVNGS